MRQKGNLEVEIRFRVDDVKKLRKTLKQAGFKCVERWQGYDMLFDKDGLLDSGQLLRLRRRRQWGSKAKLTYKSAYQNHILKVREELETWVEEPAMMEKILKSLGYRPVIQYEKRTELWVNRNGTEVVVEKLPAIGYFMEIEGSEKTIKKVAKILGYNILEESTKKSYREYFSEINKTKKKWFFKKSKKKNQFLKRI